MNTIFVGDAVEQLKKLPDGCVNTCVTSPPYFGLRDYNTAAWGRLVPGTEYYVDFIEAPESE